MICALCNPILVGTPIGNDAQPNQVGTATGQDRKFDSTTVMSVRVFAALLVVFAATAAVAQERKIENRKDGPLKNATEADPHAAITLFEIESGATTPLVINETGNALVRGVGTPTTLAVVEGSRIPIPRAADGTCPDVDATLTAAFDVPMAVFDDPAHPQPRSFLAGATEAELEHLVDNVACEVIVTRARGYVAYRRKLIKKLSGKARRDVGDVFEEPISPDVPLPTPDPSRAVIAPPPNVPIKNPAFRATTAGTIEPMPSPERPQTR